MRRSSLILIENIVLTVLVAGTAVLATLTRSSKRTQN